MQQNRTKSGGISAGKIFFVWVKLFLAAKFRYEFREWWEWRTKTKYFIEKYFIEGGQIGQSSILKWWILTLETNFLEIFSGQQEKCTSSLVIYLVIFQTLEKDINKCWKILGNWPTWIYLPIIKEVASIGGQLVSWSVICLKDHKIKKDGLSIWLDGMIGKGIFTIRKKVQIWGNGPSKNTKWWPKDAGFCTQCREHN